MKKFQLLTKSKLKHLSNFFFINRDKVSSGERKHIKIKYQTKKN